MDKSTLRFPRPTAKDRANYSYNCKESPFFSKPEKFLALGDKVRARFRIFDLPYQTKIRRDGTKVKLKTNWGWLVCKAGAIGTVIHVEPGYWPTVSFEDGTISCVTDFEVEKI